MDLRALGTAFEKDSIKLDVTVCDQTHRPSTTFGIIFSMWIVQRMQLFPVLKPLILLSKCLLYKHNLNVSFHGNL